MRLSLQFFLALIVILWEFLTKGLIKTVFALPEGTLGGFSDVVRYLWRLTASDVKLQITSQTLAGPAKLIQFLRKDKWEGVLKNRGPTIIYYGS